MIKPTYEQAKQFENDYTYVPVCKEILADDITPILMLRKLAALDQQYFLLESVEGGNLGRYSFLGYNPKLSVSCKDGVLKVKENGMVRIVPGKPKEALESILKQYRSPQIEGLPTFTGGLVGYFSYEMIQYAEPKLKIKQSDINDMELMMFDKLIAFDQVMHKLCIIVNAKTADKKAGYDKAYILFNNDDAYSVGLKDAFVQEAAVQGVEVTAVGYPKTTNDFTSYWAPVLAGGYDYLVSVASLLGLFVVLDLLPKRNKSRKVFSLRFITKPTPVWVISPSRILS